MGGIFIAAEDALEGALAGDLLPEEVRGTGYGVLATVNGVGDFLSSTLVGLLWTASQPGGRIYLRHHLVCGRRHRDLSSTIDEIKAE